MARGPRHKGKHGPWAASPHILSSSMVVVVVVVVVVESSTKGREGTQSNPIPLDGGCGSIQAGEGEALLGGLLPRRMGSRAAGPHDVDAAPGNLQAQVRRRRRRRLILLGFLLQLAILPPDAPD